jgi:hypothetical protein
VQASEPPVRVEDARLANGGSSDEIKLEGVITALREPVPNAWVITLDNGQVWRQNYPKWYPLGIGKQVKISRGRFGNSYRLTVVGTNGYVQVEPAR